jgi:hypothetical protein
MKYKISDAIKQKIIRIKNITFGINIITVRIVDRTR